MRVDNKQSKYSCRRQGVKNENQTELKTLEWDILNPDRLINLEINNKRRTIFNLDIKKKRSIIDFDIHHSKVFSSEQIKNNTT